jgi:hypothetical protein
MAITDRPRLAVLAGMEASLTLVEIARSADGLTDILFVLDGDDQSPQAGELRMVAEALGPTVVVDLSDLGACTDTLSSLRATAATTFTDRLCLATGKLNARLKGTSAPVVPWGSKDMQRHILRSAGVSRVESTRISDEESLRAFIQSAGFPVVVKPVSGVASRDVWLLAQDGEVGQFLRESGLAAGRTDLFAERYITGDIPPARHLADYVSVEVFRSSAPRTGLSAMRSPAFVTDRLLTVWPCRETGFSVPSSWSPRQQESLLTAANQALDALGATAGVFHVEMKPARPTPEIIEVNGRLGGFLSQLVRLGTGQDLGRLALSCALGGDQALDLRWQRCVIVLLFQPPARAARITEVPSGREIARLPGVKSVDDVQPAGTAVNWRNGTNFWAARVSITADDHAALRNRLVDVAGYLTSTFSFVDSSGRTVRDRMWLERLSAGTK